MTFESEAQIPRRPRISRAELSLFGVCLAALLLLGVGAYISHLSQQRGDPAQGAAISTGQWRLTRARSRMASALVGEKLWVLGGIAANRGARADAEIFDLSRSPQQSLLGTLSTVPLVARYDQTAEALGNDIYIIGGQSAPGTVLSTVEKLDTRTGFIMTLAPMPTPRRMAHSVIYKGKIYVVGGSDARARRLNTLEIYDIATDTWKRGASMRVARECDVALWNEQLIVAGGYNAAPAGQIPNVLQDVESYDIGANKWRRKVALTQRISAHHAVASGDWIFLFGDYLTLSRVLAYNARTATTRELPDCGFTPRRHVVALAHQGRAYVIGGSTDDTLPPLDEVQIFDLKRLRQMAEATP